MPIVSIPIQGGPNQNVDRQELSDGTAYKLENTLLSDSGANIGAPGFSSFADLGSVHGVSATIWNDLLFVVGTDRRFYKITSAAVVTDITGTDGGLGGTTRPNFSNDGTYIAISGGGTPQRWDGTSTVANMPGSAPAADIVEYLDGYWLAINSSGDIQWAGPSSAERDTWSAADFFQAEGLPDDPLTLAVNLRELFIFGEESTEIFQNYGDVSVPFRRVFFVERGIAAKRSVIKEGNTLWFLGNDRRVYYFEGRTPKVVSFSFDKEIQEMTTVSDCFGTRIQIDQFSLLIWTFPTEGKTFIVDAKSGKYLGEFSSFETGLKSRFRMNGYAYWPSLDKHYITDYLDSNIWELSRDYYAYGDNPRRCLRRTGPIDHGTGNKKRNVYYEFHIKRGVGNSSVSDPQFVVRFRDDDKGWSDEYLVSLGATGDESIVRRLHNTGTYRRREIEIYCTDAVEFNLTKIMESVEPLGN